MVLRFVFHGLTLWLFKNSETLLPLFHKAIATSFLALTIEEVALVRETKNLPKEACRLPFHGIPVPIASLSGWLWHLQEDSKVAGRVIGPVP